MNMASIIYNFNLINSIKQYNFYKLKILIRNSLIFLSIFTILITKCDSTSLTTTAADITINKFSNNTTNSYNKLIIENNSVINLNKSTSHNQSMISSNLHLINNSNFNKSYNKNSNISNRNSKTLVGDYLSVDNFRRNVEHKIHQSDIIDYNDDDDDNDDEDSLNSNHKDIEIDNVGINQNNNKNNIIDPIHIINYNENNNENDKYIYNVINKDNNNNDNNITLKFYDLKQILRGESNIDDNNIINLNKKYYTFNNNNEYNNSSKRGVRAARRNICEIGCKCEKDNAFIVITCDFTQSKSMDSVFNSKLEVPLRTKSFIVKLNSHTQFRIDEGLFENNKINSIRIEGLSEDSNSQIEISQNSLKGNNGPYPEITIIDVGTVILRSDSFSGEFRLTIQNSGFVKIYKHAFQNTSFEGQFSNIKDLRFDVGAFNEAQAKLTIQDSKIEELNRFEASLREIKFDNCTIGIIDTGAFDVNNINSIVFYRCKIDLFRSKAITEKLFSYNFSITNADIGVMESEAISGSGITELVLKNNNIDEIQSNAIYVVAANATISYNRINKLGDNWLRIKHFTHVHIHQNEFRDFGSMLLESLNIVFCKFENNSITNPKPGSLNIPSKYCAIREISFYQLCSCNTDWLDQITSRDIKSHSYCRIANDLKDCFKRTVYNVLAWLNEVCNYESKTLDCMKSQEQKNVNSNFIDPNDDGGFDVNWIYIIVGIIVLVILVIVVFITTVKFYTKRRQQQQQQAATHLSESNSAVSNLTPNGTAQKHQHVFSNEDRRIINQTLDILREKYPPTVYDEVNKNTQILLRGNITEMQRVKSIGDIVQALDECQNTGDDFVAFTDILYKHLASSGGTAPPIEPTYSEPVIQDDENSISSGGVTNRAVGNIRGIGPYASTAVVPGITDIQTNIDHIYAEPTSAQQPLLTNEYASPADRNDDNMVDLYSEPISNERDRKIIPPYAIIGPKAYSTNQSTNSSKHNQKPTTQSPSIFTPTSQTINQKNLPDVLHPSTSSSISANNKNNFNKNSNISNSNSSFKPLTNVQKMAKNFANDPNFHITRSPTSNRRIPKYTIPNKKQLPDNNIQSQSMHRQQQPSTSASINPSQSSTSHNNALDYDNGTGVCGYIGGSGTGALIGNFNNLNVNLSPSGEAVTTTLTGDNQSNHSGGSDITVQMDDIIEYADA